MKDFSQGLYADTVAVSSYVDAPADFGLYSNVIKRALDLVVAIAVLPFLAPVIFLMWLLVRRDGGFGFYSQTRIGQDGQEFQCWKLRTMVMDADRVLKEMCDADPKLAHEWYTNQKLENDPRITRIGRFLRATSMDELPQIWNIICGHMSFVGPRPFMANQAFLYNAAGGSAYYTVRPGITGPWQVFGRGTTTFTDRVKYDTEYCEDLSLLNDVKFVWKTFGVVLRCTGS